MHAKKKDDDAFELFFSNLIRNDMPDQANSYFSRTSACKITKFELDPFLALKIAIDLQKNRSTQDHWSEKEFIGDSSFPKY